jgi:membrane-associated phospholipid phosphatase
MIALLKKPGILLLLLVSLTGYSQTHYDTLIPSPKDSAKFLKAQAYQYGDEIVLYPKPGHFGFITKVPETFAGAAKISFNKKSIPVWTGIVSSTLLLIALDQDIANGVNNFSNHIGVESIRDYKTVVGFKLGSTPINVYEAPRNFNTALYSIGEGSTSILIVGGLYLYGKIKHNYRASSTASQLMQALITVGITTQTLKRITGRESPFVATQAGGVWRPFTSPSKYQEFVPKYDAFPSGHFATMMATVVVLSDNYPEKKWIKPLGYTLMGLCALSMVNNGVHWTSDYPLAAGIGYVCAKATVKMNRWVRK